MRDESKTVDLDVVRAEELLDIDKRRGRVKLPPRAKDGNDLVGVALSGGGLRASGFGLGFIQVLNQTGLWRFVDYLSTVSGGGYVGAFLSTLVVKRRQVLPGSDASILPNRLGPQPAAVQQHIYGGNRLIRTRELLNRYLIGVVLSNVMLFSGIIALCALIAFAWRSFDYPWFRDRAELLNLNSDLYAPFFPSILFGVGWLLAWTVSWWQRGAEASGTTARVLLFLTLGSLLIGVSLLLGNGDISINSLDSFFGRSPTTAQHGWGKSLIALIIGGLIPFLNPKRLIESGLRTDKKWWEKYIFNISSVALLIGVPLVFVGLFAQENISGYNTHPHRPLVKEDIENWPGLTSIILPYQGEKMDSSQQEVVDAFRAAIARRDPVVGLKVTKAAQLIEEDKKGKAKKNEPSGLHATPSDNAVATSNDGQEAVAKAAAASGDAATGVAAANTEPAATEPAKSDVAKSDVAKSDVAKSDVAKEEASPGNSDKGKSDEISIEIPLAYAQHEVLKDLRKIDVPQSERHGKERGELKDRWFRERFEKILPPPTAVEGKKTETWKDRLATIRHNPRGKGVPWIEKLVPVDEEHPGSPVQYLCCLALALDDALLDMSYDQAEIHYLGGWQGSTLEAIKHNLQRLLDVSSWAAGMGRAETESEIAAYWREKSEAEQIEDVICEVLNNQILNDPLLVEDLARIVSAPTEASKRRPERFEEMVNRVHKTAAANWLPYEQRELNRYYLEESLGDIFRNRAAIKRRVCIAEDQWTRLRYASVAALVFLGLSLLIDVNRTSMQRYYRNRIEKAFLLPHSSRPTTWAISDLRTTSYGAPYHLICASVGMLNAIRSTDPDPIVNDRPNESSLNQRIVPFVFSQRFCGSELTNYAYTQDFESHRVDLADAVSLSGAAVTPSYVGNPLIAFLMFALNLRLGQWIPNPRRLQYHRRATLFSLMRNYLRSPHKNDHCFVTDGGYSDNLGILPLLDRRCRLIIAVDASHDQDHQFGDLARVLRAARVHSGIRFEEIENSTELRTDFLKLSAPSFGVCTQHFLFARILYPPDKLPDNGEDQSPDQPSEGLLIYVKPSFTGDESLDLMQYRAKSPEFPHESSSDQMFEDDQVESYRQLGFHIGTKLMQLIPPVREGKSFWRYQAVDDAHDDSEKAKPENVGIWSSERPINTEQLCNWFLQRDSLPATDAAKPEDVAQSPADLLSHAVAKLDRSPQLGASQNQWIVSSTSEKADDERRKAASANAAPGLATDVQPSVEPAESVSATAVVIDSQFVISGDWPQTAPNTPDESTKRPRKAK